jgi:hypothetical protein
MEKNKLGLFYAKHDSSLSYGFEIVSHPFTWGFMTKNRSAFEPIFDLRQMGVTSYNTSTCGMHVHMSRRAFSHSQILKFIKMFYNNPTFTFRLSRRNHSSFDCYSSLRKLREPIKLARYNQADYSGRGALNFGNSATIECRIFRGTINPNGWFANIEFLQALYEYSAIASFSEMTPTLFLDWARYNAKRFPFFNSVLVPRVIAENLEEASCA